MNNKVIIILTSAILYGISIPISKVILQNEVSPIMLGGFAYLGAGVGLGIYNLFKNFILKKPMENAITKKDIPYIVAMVTFNILAIAFLMNGILRTNSANASLLSNCEIAATSLIALIIFKEAISSRLWMSIILIIIAGGILTFEGSESFDFSIGSILVIIAYICWGAENNCTKMLSKRNSEEIAIIKGCCCGFGGIILALIFSEYFPTLYWSIITMIMGFFSYGLSVSMYIKSQKYLGAAKTAAYFSIAPFLGVLFSLFILNETPTTNFYIALLLMIFAAILISKDK